MSLGNFLKSNRVQSWTEIDELSSGARSSQCEKYSAVQMEIVKHER